MAKAAPDNEAAENARVRFRPIAAMRHGRHGKGVSQSSLSIDVIGSG